MRDVMIDLEALGLYPGCVLLSLGAVYFDLESDDLGAQFYMNIDKVSCLARGMHVEAETEGWWAKQSAEARARLLTPEPVHIEVVLQCFKDWSQQNNKTNAQVRVWSNGASFDIPLLRDAERRTGHKMPWNYRNERDTRTLMHVAEYISPDYFLKEIAHMKWGTSHNALDDAIKQAKQMQLCWRKVK